MIESFTRQKGGAKNDGGKDCNPNSFVVACETVVTRQPSRKNEVPNVTKPTTVAPQRNRKTSQCPHPNGVQLGSHRLLRNRSLICVQERAGTFKIILFHNYFIDDRLTTVFSGVWMQKGWALFWCRRRQAHFGIQWDGIEISSILGIRSPLYPWTSSKLPWQRAKWVNNHHPIIMSNDEQK